MESIKTLEFKLYPNQQQIALIDKWLDIGREVWNKGLEILEELQQRKWREKSGFAADDGKEAWEWYVNVWDKKERGEDSLWVDAKNKPTDRVMGLCCSIVNYGTQKRFKLDDPIYSVKLRQSYEQDYSKSPKSIIYNASKGVDMCTRFKNGIIDDLITSWKAYQDPKRGMMRKPKFKGKRFPLVSLSNANASKPDGTPDTIKINGCKIQFPRIGKIRFKGDQRLSATANVREARICKKVSGYYLQLAIKDYWSQPKIKHPEIAVGVDPGVVFATTLSTGRQKESVAVNANYIKRETKIKRLQRKLSRQVKGSGEWQKTKTRIGKLHEKQARQRSAYWHKESTYLVGNYGCIAIEDNSHANMRRRCKPQLRADGSGYLPNGQKAKSGLNRSLSKVGAGALKVMVKAKAIARGNDVHLVASHYNSQTCSNCGCVNKKNRLSQSLFICVDCGYNMNADVNAAINVVKRAGVDNVYETPTPVSLGKVKPVKDGMALVQSSSMQPEGSLTTSPEITGQSTPHGEDAFGKAKREIKKISEPIPKAAIGKAKRQSKKKQDCQKPQAYTQLSLWDL